MRDDTFQIAQLGWIDSMTLDNPQEMFGLWNTDYSQRFSNYNNPTVEQMANLASLFSTRAEKLEYVEQFQRVAMADLPILPLFLRIEVPDRDGDGVPDAQDACPDQSNGGYDADNDGCLDTTTALKALINNLRASGQISKTATATTLLKYVTSAEAKLAVKNYTGAIAYLNAFISYVQKNSKTGGSITPAAAQKLIAYAQSLIRWIQELDNLRLGALLEYSNNEEFPQLVTAEDQGLRLAIEQANAAGGVLGQLVLLNQRDSGYQDDTMAQNAAGDLATNLKVSAVIGPVTSRTTQAVLASVIVPAGVVEISPSSTGPAIADIPDNGLLFRLADSDAIRGAAAAQQACLDGKHKAAIIVQGGDVGGAIDLAFRNAFQAPGCGGVVQRTVEFNGDPGDTLRQALGNDPLDMPDLIFVGIYFDDNLVYELAQAAPCVLGPDGSRASQRSWSFAGKLPDDFSQHVLENLACGAVVDAGEFAGWASLAPAYEHDYGPASFATAYQAAYGMAPEPFANLAYDAAALVMLAAEEAHSNSPALIKAHLPTVASGGTPVYDLVQALALVRAGTNIDWQGSYALQVGGISFAFNHAFDANGETSGVYLVFRLQSDGLLTLEGTVTP
jgi:branched-chain amino acid transport system substrate-binding protein